MDEQNKDTEEQIKFTQLLKELADTQVTLAKINAQLAIRESKDQIETIVDSKSKELIEQAKKFGTKLEKIEQEYANQNADREGIVEEFEKRLAEASEEYDKILQDIMEKKAQFELDENGILLEQKRNNVKMAAENKEFAKAKQRLEKEIVQALKSGDMPTLQQKTEELKSHIENNPTDIRRAHAQELQARREEIKQAIESCKNEYEQIMAERKKMLEEISSNKNKQLMTIPKQNIFAKALGNIFNKFNGTKKFVKGVIEPLKTQIGQIRNEEIPKIKSEIDSKRKTFLDKAVQKRADIEKSVEEKVEGYAEKLANTQENAVQKVSLFKKAMLEYADMAKAKVGETKENMAFTVKDKIEDAQILALMAQDFAKDKIADAQILGLYAQDFVKDKVEDVQILGLYAQDFAKDKIADTKQMATKAQEFISNKVANAKESVVKRKEAILVGFNQKKAQAIQVAQTTKDNVIQFGKDTRGMIITGVDNSKKVVTTYVKDTMEAGKRTYRGIINKGYEIKSNMIEAAQQRLSAQQQEIQQKRQQLNMNIKEANGIEVGD